MIDRDVTRRTALKAMAVAPALAAAGVAKAAELGVEVLLDEPIGTIKPEIYSQFAEHIGGVIYDGIWVGPDSKVPNVDGIRKELVEHVKRIGKVVVRWPGGCFADRYDWKTAATAPVPAYWSAGRRPGPGCRRTRQLLAGSEWPRCSH